MTSRRLFVLTFLVALASSSVRAGEVPTVVLEAYLKVQTALAADSLAEAQAGARELSKQAASLGSAVEKPKAAADSIVSAADIKVARAAFGDLSDAMLAMVGEGTGGKDVRIAYCPMVKRSWLQKGDQIANPYYGSAMLRCGQFKK
jgi:hypothetical protein